MMRTPGFSLPPLFTLCLAALLGACTPPASDAPARISVEVLSNRPYLLSGGDVLIEISTDIEDADMLQVLVNEQPKAVEIVPFAGDAKGQVYRAVIDGLAEGDNVLQVSAGGGASQVALVNYPIEGPIFSGERQSPYFCLSDLSPQANGQKRRFAIGNGEMLEDSALDAACTLPTRVDYVYFSKTPKAGFLPLRDLSALATKLPDDLAYTRTSEGEEVPFIVRLETGTINRAIYQIALLHDPRTPAPTATAPSSAWNERIVYTFGGGCEAGYYQATETGGVLRESILGKGYAVLSSTLNVNSQGGCNDVLSAETAMMVKEHFIDHYGAPLFTIGNGASGGAMQQLLIAGAYPGILDGILPRMTFSDAVSYMTDSEECAMPLRRVVNDPALGLSDETKAAIGGWPNWYLCDVSLGERPDRIAPDDCPEPIPVPSRYDPISNPEGVRCSIYDGMRNIFGERLFPEINGVRAFAVSPHDNVGVQYGLQALNEGLIDKALFLTLNERIGGWDIDFQPTSSRTVGDDAAIRIAYETGRVTSGGTGLAAVPIIDDRPYLDHEGNFHASVYSFTTRARLIRDNGHADNYVIRRHFSDLSLEDENLELMNQWLMNLRQDHSDASLLERIVRARPATLQDDCFTAAGEHIVEDAVFDMDRLFDNTGSRCNAVFPPHAGLRLVAGGPLSNDILKCELRRIDYRDYRVEFSDDEKARLEAAFPQGVCDWSRPGVHQTENQTWLSFGPSPVNLYRP